MPAHQPGTQGDISYLCSSVFICGSNTGMAQAGPVPADVDAWHGANPIDPAFRADPHPFLKHLREVDPVNETPVGIWRLTRYADCVRLLTQVPTGVRMADGKLFGE